MHWDDASNDDPPDDATLNETAIYDDTAAAHDAANTETSKEHACDTGAIHTYGEHDGANIILVVRDGQQCIQ